jgi:hypothetical protein
LATFTMLNLLLGVIAGAKQSFTDADKAETIAEVGQARP